MNLLDNLIDNEFGYLLKVIFWVEYEMIKW